MGLVHEADGLPAESASKAPVTILGAAHHWAGRAKQAEADLRELEQKVGALRTQLWLWRTLALVAVPPGLVALVMLWIRG